MSALAPVVLGRELNYLSRLPPGTPVTAQMLRGIIERCFAVQPVTVEEPEFETDYAGPLIDARQLLTELENQLINKKDLDAARRLAVVAVGACGAIVQAIDGYRVKQAAGKVVV